MALRISASSRDPRKRANLRNRPTLRRSARQQHPSALESGRTCRLVEPDELLPAAKAVAEEIAGKGPLAIAAAKRVIRDGMDRPLPDANAKEITAFGTGFESADQREGMTAFVEKRAPNFQGR